MAGPRGRARHRRRAQRALPARCDRTPAAGRRAPPPRRHRPAHRAGQRHSVRRDDQLAGRHGRDPPFGRPRSSPDRRDRRPGAVLVGERPAGRLPDRADAVGPARRRGSRRPGRVRRAGRPQPGAPPARHAGTAHRDRGRERQPGVRCAAGPGRARPAGPVRRQRGRIRRCDRGMGHPAAHHGPAAAGRDDRGRLPDAADGRGRQPRPAAARRAGHLPDRPGQYRAAGSARPALTGPFTGGLPGRSPGAYRAGPSGSAPGRLRDGMPGDAPVAGSIR